jgi:hypothetical protein
MHLGDQLPLNLQFRGFPCGVGKEKHSLRPNDRHLPLLFLPELLFDAAVPGFGESVFVRRIPWKETRRDQWP